MSINRKLLHLSGLQWHSILDFEERRAVALRDIEDQNAPTVYDLVNVASSADPMWLGHGESEPTYIGEFTPERRANLYRWLLRHAAAIEFRYSYADRVSPLGPMGEAAVDAHDQMLDERAENPVTWLCSTRFVRALQALLIGDGNSHVIEGDHGPAYAQRLAAGIEF